MKPYYQDDAVTIYHGDALDVLRDIPTESAAAFVTDPPYGMDYQSARRTDKAARLPKIANDTRPFIWWLLDAYRIVREAGSVLCFCRWDSQETFRVAIEAAGFLVKGQLVWDREAHGMGDLTGAFAPQHDVMWFGVRGAFAFHSKRPKSLLRQQRLSGEALLHPNEKPVGLMLQLITSLTAQYLSSNSIPIALRPLCFAATSVEPLPLNGSMTRSPCGEAISPRGLTPQHRRLKVFGNYIRDSLGHSG